MAGPASLGAEHPFDAPGSLLTRLALDQRRLLSGNYWSELRTFLAVAKAKTLSAAAEQLGSSHATVGRDVKRLQDLLGAQLVVLSKGGAALTPEGRQLAEALLKIDHGIFSVISHLRVEARDTHGVVKLSVTDGLGVVFVVPALRRFARDFPGVAVQLKSPTNFKSLRENQTDIMLGFSPDPSPDMTSQPLGWLHFLPIASHDYVERHGLPSRRRSGATPSSTARSIPPAAASGTLGRRSWRGPAACISATPRSPTA